MFSDMRIPAVASIVALSLTGLAADSGWGLVDAVYGHDSQSGSSFPLSAINSMWPFHSDEGYITGSSGTPSQEYSTSAMSLGEGDWAPARVYACGRYINGQNASKYVLCRFSNLVPNSTYRLDWLAAETWTGASVGSRKNTIEVNGTVVLSQFDILAETGAANVAVTKSFEVTSDSDGTLAVKMSYGGANNTRYGGLAVFGQNVPSSLALRYDSENDELVYSAKDALTYTLETSKSESGPWTMLNTELANGGEERTLPGCGFEYCRLVASNGVGVATSGVVRQKVRKYALVDAVYATDASQLSDAQLAAMLPFRSDAGMCRSSFGFATTSNRHFDKTFTLGEEDWAPGLVYQVERYRNGQEDSETLEVTFTNLTANAVYIVQYMGAECHFTESGKRVFSMSLNGNEVERYLDLFEAAGGRYVALTRSYFCTADSQGRILVSFRRSVNNAKYGGLAILGTEAPHNVALSYDAERSMFVASDKEALTCTLQRSVDEVHWEDVQTVPGADGAAVDIPAVPGSYFRLVASNDVSNVVSSVVAASPVATADKTVYAWDVGISDGGCGRFAPLGMRDFGGVYPRCVYQDPSNASEFAARVPVAVYSQGMVKKTTPFTFDFPALDSAKTYVLRRYYISGTSAAFDETSAVPDANGVYSYSSDANVAICGLELVEKDASDCLPLKAEARAVSFASGTAVVPTLQCAGTTFEVRRRRGGVYEVLASGVKRVWVDADGTAGDTYSVRAIAPSGALGAWSDECTAEAVESASFLGVADHIASGSTEMDGSRVWRSMRDFGVSDEGLYYYSISSSAADYSLLTDPPGSLSLLSTAHWVASQTDGVRLFLRGLVPGMGYRVRLLLCDTYASTSVLGGRVMDVRVNGKPWASDVDAFKARGRNGWGSVEGRAIASQQGAIYVNVTSTVQNPQIVSAEAVLDDFGPVSGGNSYVQGEERVLDGVLTLPDSCVYAFSPEALAVGSLHVDGVPVAGEALIGAGTHRLRFRSPASAAPQTLTIRSSSMSETGVGELLSDAPAAALSTSLVFSGSGDFLPVSTNADGTAIWRLSADQGDFTVTSAGNTAVGEVSFRIRSVRDFNEHGLRVCAFAGESSAAAEAGSTGMSLAGFTGMPLWVRATLRNGVVTCSASQDGVDWQDLSQTAVAGGLAPVGLRIHAPNARQCQVEIDRLRFTARPRVGFLLIFR